ncbi:hypothetical protein ACJX0J_037940, partial [Zea mays]
DIWHENKNPSTCAKIPIDDNKCHIKDSRVLKGVSPDIVYAFLFPKEGALLHFLVPLSNARTMIASQICGFGHARNSIIVYYIFRTSVCFHYLLSYHFRTLFQEFYIQVLFGPTSGTGS